LTITSKSDFVLEIKFGRVYYGNNLAGICDNQIESEKNDGNGIVQEFVYGIKKNEDLLFWKSTLLKYKFKPTKF